MSPPLLDPRNDLVFKLQFAHSLPLLTDLINAVRSDEAPVTVQSVTNPRIDASEIGGKYIVLDILAQTAAGEWINIEMQMNPREKWSARSMFYLARTLSEQLPKGGQYATLKPVIGIHLLAYDLFPNQQQARWCFEMRDRTNPEVLLGSELQLNIVELRKADRLSNAGKAHGLSARKPISPALAAWIQYFQHWQEDSIMNQIDYAPVQQALAHLHALSADEETRHMAERRAMALMIERTELEAGWARGKAEGKLEGKLEGRLEGKLESLQNLINAGIPEAQARAMLQLPAH
jgi:predicted transposase/invertase (TIGR01784 family)